MYRTTYSCQILTKKEFFRQSFEKYANIKFNENPSSVRPVVPCGQTGMTKSAVDFHNSAHAPNKRHRLLDEPKLNLGSFIVAGGS